MKADDLQFIASYLFLYPKKVPGVHVGIRDTEGPAIFSIREWPRYAKPIYFLNARISWKQTLKRQLS